MMNGVWGRVEALASCPTPAFVFTNRTISSVVVRKHMLVHAHARASRWMCERMKVKNCVDGHGHASEATHYEERRRLRRDSSVRDCLFAVHQRMHGVGVQAKLPWAGH